MDYRVVAPHLLLSLLLLAACGRGRVVAVMVLAGLLLTPSFLAAYGVLATRQFTDEQARFDAFARQTAGTLVYQAQDDPWCNTILLPLRTAFLPESLAIPAGIGISFDFDISQPQRAQIPLCHGGRREPRKPDRSVRPAVRVHHGDWRPVHQRRNAVYRLTHGRTMTVSWLIRAVTFGLLAITLPLAVRGLYGPQGALVNVRWQSEVDAAERQHLETEWQLRDGQEVSPSTWRYDLIAPSEGRLRTIVQHAAVADTHNIDRQRYTLAPEAPRTARRHGLITTGGAVAIGLVDRLALLLAMLAGLCVLVRHPVQALRGSAAGVRPLGGAGAAEATEISDRSLERAAAVTAIAAGVAALVAIAARTEVLTNDDTYIYFNYAKNFVAGRPFAYDPRNIPSEGFTSAIYLLLLVPFEAAGINMMFAAVILNLAAIALILYLGYRILRADRVLEGGFLLVALTLFALFVARDTNIPSIVGRGLETMLGPASVLWAIFHLARVHQAGDEATRPSRRDHVSCRLLSVVSDSPREHRGCWRRSASCYSASCGGADKLRPCWCGWGRSLRVLGAYFAGKLLLFGDLMQTSYYRKMRSDGAGREYVFGALNDYWRWILYAVVLAVCAAGLLLWRRRERGWNTFRCLAPRSSVLALGVVAGGDSGGVPAVGADRRLRLSLSGQFLWSSCICSSPQGLHICCLSRPRESSAVSSTQGRSSRVWWRCCGRRRLPRATPGPDQSSSVSACTRRRRKRRRNIEYIRIGEFLRDRIPDIEELTFVFGDAGVFPYVLGSRFVDANGLTEPYLARLLREPNEPEKARMFADYGALLAAGHHHPRVLAGRTTGAGSRWTTSISPFLGPTPMSVFRAYRDYGIGYVCTARAYYNLHFGVRQTSKHFEPASTALLEYCGQNGLVLDDGLTVTLDGEEVYFPG